MAVRQESPKCALLEAQGWQNVTMSHAVKPQELASHLNEYGTTPFLLYASQDGSARINHVLVSIPTNNPDHADDEGGNDQVVEIAVTGFGRGVAARVAAGAPLSLLWPATAPGTFSLIADGTGTIDEDAMTLNIAITAAVLHRPAPVDGPSSC